MSIEISTAGQGLNVISSNGKNVGLISNHRGVWSAYKFDFAARKQVGDSYNVTRMINRPELATTLASFGFAD